MKQGLMYNFRLLLGRWAEIKENGSLIIKLNDGKDSLNRSILLWNPFALCPDSDLTQSKERAPLRFDGRWACFKDKAPSDTIVISIWFQKFLKQHLQVTLPLTHSWEDCSISATFAPYIAHTHTSPHRIWGKQSVLLLHTSIQKLSWLILTSKITFLGLPHEQVLTFTWKKGVNGLPLRGLILLQDCGATFSEVSRTTVLFRAHKMHKWLYQRHAGVRAEH